MRKYAIRRILQALPVLFGITLISFTIIHLAPGDPAALLIDPEASTEDVLRIRAALGLDQPIYVQYVKWLGNLLRGDLGRSFLDGQPVLQKILEVLPNTIQLTLTAFVLSLTLGIIIGVISATRRYSVVDHVSTVFAFFGISMPNFWFGLMLILIFSLQLRWLPSHGMHTLGVKPNFLDTASHMVLPVMVLGLEGLASISRYMRSSLLEVIRQDYIRTARAKGLAERVVIYKHAIKNALLPVITILGLSLPGLVGGAFIIETLFAWPGMGRLGVQSVFTRDYPTIMGINLMASTLTVLFNLLADLAYALADPRIKYN